MKKVKAFDAIAPRGLEEKMNAFLEINRDFEFVAVSHSSLIDENSDPVYTAILVFEDNPE